MKAINQTTRIMAARLKSLPIAHRKVLSLSKDSVVLEVCCVIKSTLLHKSVTLAMMTLTWMIIE